MSPKPPRKQKILLNGLTSDERTASLDSGYRSPGRLEQDTEEEKTVNTELQKTDDDSKYGAMGQSDHERDIDFSLLSQTKCVIDNSWSLPNLDDATYVVDQDLGEPNCGLYHSTGTHPGGFRPPLPPRKVKTHSLSTLEEQKGKTVQDS